MGIFSKEPRFYPNCRPVQGSTAGRVVLECQPQLHLPDGKVLTGERPMQIVLEKGRPPQIVDDGGTPEEMIGRLEKYIHKYNP